MRPLPLPPPPVNTPPPQSVRAVSSPMSTEQLIAAAVEAGFPSVKIKDAVTIVARMIHVRGCNNVSCDLAFCGYMKSEKKRIGEAAQHAAQCKDSRCKEPSCVRLKRIGAPRNSAAKHVTEVMTRGALDAPASGWCTRVSRAAVGVLTKEAVHALAWAKHVAGCKKGDCGCRDLVDFIKHAQECSDAKCKVARMLPTRSALTSCRAMHMCIGHAATCHKALPGCLRFTCPLCFPAIVMASDPMKLQLDAKGAFDAIYAMVSTVIKKQARAAGGSAALAADEPPPPPPPPPPPLPEGPAPLSPVGIREMIRLRCGGMASDAEADARVMLATQAFARAFIAAYDKQVQADAEFGYACASELIGACASELIGVNAVPDVGLVVQATRSRWRYRARKSRP